MTRKGLQHESCTTHSLKSTQQPRRLSSNSILPCFKLDMTPDVISSLLLLHTTMRGEWCEDGRTATRVFLELGLPSSQSLLVTGHQSLRASLQRATYCSSLCAVTHCLGHTLIFSYTYPLGIIRRPAVLVWQDAVSHCRQPTKEMKGTSAVLRSSKRSLHRYIHFVRPEVLKLPAYVRCQLTYKVLICPTVFF